MNRLDLRCYRCNGKIEQTVATAPSPTGEMTIWYQCTLCGQLYEATLTTISVYALSSDGEALTLLKQCGDCGQLFQAHETHSCAAVVVDESALYGDAASRVWTLGDYRLECRTDQQQWQSLTDVPMEHQQARALLHCLISSPGRMLGREQIIKTLWPVLDARTAANHLDKAAYNLSHLLEPGRNQTASSSVLLVEHSMIMLAGQSQLWVDADAFEALLGQARTGSDPGQTEQLLEEAMQLYGGDYLPEERDIPWVQARRESLQRSWIGLLLELADLRIAREALPSAIDTLDRLLAVDPANEAAVQRLIILLAQSGRRAEATRIYQRFASVLKEEYKIVPLPETRALLRRRSGR